MAQRQKAKPSQERVCKAHPELRALSKLEVVLTDYLFDKYLLSTKCQLYEMILDRNDVPGL